MVAFGFFMLFKAFSLSLFTAIALVRKRNIDEWAEQRLKHVLLMIYLKDNNFAAAKEIVNKVCAPLSTLNRLYKRH